MRGREEVVLGVCVDRQAPPHLTLMPLELLTEYGQVDEKAEGRWIKGDWKRADWKQISLGDQALKKEKMLFLITGYAKYRCPYVWVRPYPIQTVHSPSSVTIPSRTTAAFRSSRQSTSAHQDRRVENKSDVTDRMLVGEDIQQLELKRLYLTRILSSETR
ncbi:hypothetical protein RO3G_15503 [Rhizopus delemar RA 99-880]|uniref:DUF7886 domain-containing protein n=1 Tax=Rhizopus delemar (strain RA 99-880 / ATCC MYA-4621 / FGSC 9543 / NRRL 43880) TaxID=246409 RepID=I1CQR2_RHIO9|nr:hypothetical protein RO3G_15503 [Rhizopus delemar RA 99-880]|eukprot:EIE90792.1 hypothetical protein RO3G_15503 [Rhizopus delemar RA 99-880]